MSSLTRCVSFAAAATVSAAGSFTHWVHQKHTQLPEGERGSLATRMKETAQSTFSRRKIDDRYTASRHTELVASLPSSHSTATNGKADRELNILKQSHNKGYLMEAIPTGASPAFHCEGRLHPGHRFDDCPSGFVFAGAVPQIHDEKARKSILDGTYIRCASALSTRDPTIRTATRYKKVDVLLTGTTDPDKCRQFNQEHLRDVALAAAHPALPMDPSHAYSDTPVFNHADNTFYPQGDLSELPGALKQQILDANFTVCPDYLKRKTRLSENEEKSVGAVIVGTANANACEALSSHQPFIDSKRPETVYPGRIEGARIS